jgi:zinc transport system substrate-binding protein
MRCFHTVALLTAAAALTACGSSAAEDTAAPAGAGRAPVLDVAVGFYPYAFVTERVGGADVAVTNLTAPGAEPHDLELTPQQVARLAEADLVVFSRGFQPAVDAAVEQQAPDRGFDVLTAVALREVEEHEGEEHEGEEHEGEEHEGEEHEGEEHAHEGHAHEGVDPHVWLDPTRLATIAAAVAERLAERAPERAEAFRDRAAQLQAELAALDAELTRGLAACQRREIVTSHDAFGYLADAYGLEQVPLGGLSPEDGASPARMVEVAGFAQEHGVTTIFFEDIVSPKVAQSLAREVGATAAELRPLEGAPASGDYLSGMRDNLLQLRTALDCR